MENRYRINWKRGLDITPEILISSDNYHEAERNLISSILASRFYGILPDSKFYIEKEINSNYLIVKSLSCLAVTPEGVIISIPKENRMKKEIVLNEMEGNEFYLVLSVNPNSLTITEDKEIYICPDYNLTIKKTTEPVEFGIPVLKIFHNNYWEIDKNFVPPSIALNSVEFLLQKYFEINSLLHNILAHFPDKKAFGLHLILLKLELNDFTSKKSPEEWDLLMKKFCWIFYSYLKNENKIDENNIMKNFIEDTYNPNEIGRIFQLGYECFQEIYSFFEDKPEEIDEIKL
jgi:hypothetical protein